AFLTIPVAMLLGAYIWQFLPEKPALRLSRARFLFLTVTALIGLAAAAVVGPLSEKLLFAGDLKGWLAGPPGSARSGWFRILLPLSMIGGSFAFNEFLSPWMRRVTTGKSRHVTAAADLGRFAVIIAGSALVSAGFGAALSAAGVDARGSLLGTYVERN